MRELYKEEVAAMWIYSADYASQREGAIEYYVGLSAHTKHLVAEFLTTLESAKPYPKRTRTNA